MQNAKRYTFNMTNQTGNSYTVDVDTIPARLGCSDEREAWITAVHRVCGMGGSMPQAIRLVSEAHLVGEEWKPITIWDENGRGFSFHELQVGD